jgi:hypothetical protein
MKLFRGAIPRLIRASLVATATLALPVSGVATLLPARAAGSIVYQQYANAMTKVFAYRATVDEQVGASAAQTSTVLHIVMNVVRKGKLNQMDAQISVSAGGLQNFTAEEVYTGTHSCVKISMYPIWNCKAQTLPGLNIYDLTPTNFLDQAGGSNVGFKPIGSKTIAGVRSTGYSVYGAQIESLGIHGTIWLDTANHRVSEFDWSEKSQNAQYVSLKMVYSHYNDTSLHINSVPAS